MIKQKTSKYRTEEGQFVTSWIQLNILGRKFCFFKKTIHLDDKKLNDYSPSLSDIDLIVSESCIKQVLQIAIYDNI